MTEFSAPPATRREIAGLGLFLIAIAGFLSLRDGEQAYVALILKVIPVACLMQWILGTGGRFSRLILAGLGFSLLGDALLALPGDYFLPGLVAFLVAHLCYIAAFVGENRSLKPLRALPIALWVAGLTAFLYPGLGAMAVPVMVYAATIGCMMWRAWALIETPSAGWQIAAATGALLFGLSDSTLAVMRFHGAFAGGGTFLILAYWGGQLGIALAARRR